MVKKKKVQPKVLPELKVTLTRRKPKEKLKTSFETWLGGFPNFQQHPEFPRCESCEIKMTFVGQIGSVEHLNSSNPLGKDPVTEKQDYMFADVGTIYVFFCFDCLEAKSILQFS
jgi:hypothetical protein